MSIISLLILIISFSLFYLALISKINKENFTNDLLFFLLIGFILIFTLSVFYFYFQDYNLSFVVSLILVLNNILLLKELVFINKYYLFIILPYFLYFTYVSIKIFTKLI